MALISVIIPVYNVETYLDKCLNSIINQTFNDIEIICVNDGSTDGSLEILNRFASCDNRIKVINKKNGGLSSARNVGLENATSKWISFIDSDDWLDLDAYKKLSEAFKFDPDIICFGTHIRGDVNPAILESDEKYYRVKYSGLQNLNDEIRLRTDVATWNKIYKKSIIDSCSLRFPLGRHYEDYPFYWEYMFESKTSYYFKDKFYNYLRREGSIMMNTFSKSSAKAMDHLYASEIIYEYLKKRGILKDHLTTFSDIFVNCFWFSYIHLPIELRNSLLVRATKLVRKFDSSVIPRGENIMVMLKNKNYNFCDEKIQKTRRHFLEFIFSVRNENIHKVISIFGLKLKFRSKRLQHREEQRWINQQILSILDRLQHMQDVMHWHQNEQVRQIENKIDKLFKMQKEQSNEIKRKRVIAKMK